MNGSKERVANEAPPEGPYIIRTGFRFDDERTGRRFALLMCSVEQDGSSWLEEETASGNRRRLACRRDDLGETHGKMHPVISLQEAVEWGVLDVAEGAVLISNECLLWTLARRIAS
jgi:hypothetical protein